MNKGEFLDVKESKSFNEFKVYKAEQYYPLETKNTAKEVVDIKENFAENDETIKSERQLQTKSNDELQKQLEKATKSTNTSSSSSGSNATHAISESSVAVSGGTAAVTVTAAAVVISVTGAGMGFASFDKYIKNNEIGNDYVSVNINLDKIISQYDKSYGLNENNFLLKFNDDNQTSKNIPLRSGDHTYVIGGLTPLKSYSYVVECKNPVVGNNDTVYKSSFTTLEYSDPKCVRDEVNTYITLISSGNEDGATTENTTALLTYSIYLSDYEKQYDSPTFFVCSSPQEDPNNLTNVLYLSEDLDDENFFKGEVNDIIFDNIYLYVVGEKSSSKSFLYRDQINIIYPEGEDIEGRVAFEVDESMEDNSSTIDTIKLSGSLIKVSEVYPFRVKFDLFDEFGNVLVSDLGGLLNIDKANLTYEMSCRAFYNTKTFKYTIYMINPNSESINVYESGFKEYNVDQSFDATYDMVSPENASIEYNEDNIKINVLTNFNSSFMDIFYYQLKVVNSSGVVYGTYEGNGNAEIIIDNFEGLDSINFIYTNLGRFANGDIEYGSYTSTGQPFSYPQFYFDNNLGINGDNYALTYYCDMVYDYSLASAKIYTIINNELYEYEINTLSNKGTVDLIGIKGAHSDLVFSVDISFVDNQASHEIKTITKQLAPIQLQYELRLNMVEANIFDNDGTNFIARFAFDNIIPASYYVNIKDDTNLIDLNIDPSRKEVFKSFAMDTVYNLTFSIIDENAIVTPTSITVNLDASSAGSTYEEFSSTCLNPGDAVITYNDDGTFNIYRKIDYESTSTSNYTNAMIFNTNSTDSETGETIYVGRIDNIIQEQYSKIERIPRGIYCFAYLNYYLLNDVYYIMFREFPSGSVSGNVNPMSFEYVKENGKTKIVVSNSTYGRFENRAVVNGIECQIDNYDISTYDSLSIILDQEIDVTEVKLYFAIQDYNYDTYSNDITLLGNRYDEIIVSSAGV